MFELVMLLGQILSIVFLGLLIFFVLDKIAPGFVAKLFPSLTSERPKHKETACPYCGSTEIEHVFARWDDSTFHTIECRTCHRRARADSPDADGYDPQGPARRS